MTIRQTVTDRWFWVKLLVVINVVFVLWSWIMPLSRVTRFVHHPFTAQPINRPMPLPSHVENGQVLGVSSTPIAR